MQAKGTIENRRGGGGRASSGSTVAGNVEPHRRVHHFSWWWKIPFQEGYGFYDEASLDTHVSTVRHGVVAIGE